MHTHGRTQARASNETVGECDLVIVLGGHKRETWFGNNGCQPATSRHSPPRPVCQAMTRHPLRDTLHAAHTTDFSINGPGRRGYRYPGPGPAAQGLAAGRGLAQTLPPCPRRSGPHPTTAAGVQAPPHARSCLIHSSNHPRRGACGGTRRAWGQREQVHSNRPLGDCLDGYTGYPGK